VINITAISLIRAYAGQSSLFSHGIASLGRGIGGDGISFGTGFMIPTVEAGSSWHGVRLAGGSRFLFGTLCADIDSLLTCKYIFLCHDWDRALDKDLADTEVGPCVTQMYITFPS